MKKKSVFILFYSLSVNILFAQYTDFNHVNFYPPQSASLMRYIDYPIGYSTGIPDINIPLYTISSNKLSFALKLSFHIDNYLRINQLPGVAGAGWTLNNKISITRAIRGVDDFFRKKTDTIPIKTFLSIILENTLLKTQIIYENYIKMN